METKKWLFSRLLALPLLVSFTYEVEAQDKHWFLDTFSTNQLQEIYITIIDGKSIIIDGFEFYGNKQGDTSCVCATEIQDKNNHYIFTEKEFFAHLGKREEVEVCNL
jgi:hypothetical protein